MRPSHVLLAVMATAFVALASLNLVATGGVITPLPAPRMRCLDSDDGIDPYHVGTVRAWADVRNVLMGTDVCYGSFDVYEFYCRDGIVQTIVVGCPSLTSCSEGACVQTFK